MDFNSISLSYSNLLDVSDPGINQRRQIKRYTIIFIQIWVIIFMVVLTSSLIYIKMYKQQVPSTLINTSNTTNALEIQGRLLVIK